MPHPEPRRQLAPTGFRCPQLIPLRMNPGQHGVYPREGHQRHGTQRGKQPRSQPTGRRRIPQPFDPVEQSRESRKPDLPLEESKQDRLRNPARFARGKGILDRGAKDHRDGHEGHPDSSSQPEREDEQGQSWPHPVKIMLRRVEPQASRWLTSIP